MSGFLTSESDTACIVQESDIVLLYALSPICCLRLLMDFSKKVFLFPAVVALLSWIPVAQSQPPGTGWQLVFVDDFSGTSLNESIWTTRNNMTHGDQEWQLYLDDEAWLANSNLVIRTRINPTMYGSRLYNWTSAWVDSAGKLEPTYGYIEWRAKLPDPTAANVWPALWLVQDQTKCWPVGGEIDTMEAVGGLQNNSVFGTYHWGEACGVDDWVQDK